MKDKPYDKRYLELLFSPFNTENKLSYTFNIHKIFN